MRPKRSVTASARASSAQAACFSFYATKNLTCGEGGAVATQDAAWRRAVRRLRSHGLSKEAASRYNTDRYQHWDMLELGYKANLSDIQAALLLGQLPRVDAQLARREAIASGVRKGVRRRFPASTFPGSRPARAAHGTCSRSGRRPNCVTRRCAACRSAGLASRSTTAPCTC